LTSEVKTTRTIKCITRKKSKNTCIGFIKILTCGDATWQVKLKFRILAKNIDIKVLLIGIARRDKEFNALHFTPSSAQIYV
jgi:hypothetical protein